jgi:hypothetical protein
MPGFMCLAWLIEMAQVRRRLIFAGRHQTAVGKGKRACRRLATRGKLPHRSRLWKGTLTAQQGLGRSDSAGRLGDVVGIVGHRRDRRSISSTCFRPPSGSRGRVESNFPALQVLADRNEDLAAAIDDNWRAGPREAWPKGNLDNRNEKQRREKENNCPHVIPRQVDVPGEVTAGANDINFILIQYYKIVS